jgi:hypothetical protein
LLLILIVQSTVNATEEKLSATYVGVLRMSLKTKATGLRPPHHLDIRMIFRGQWKTLKLICVSVGSPPGLTPNLKLLFGGIRVYHLVMDRGDRVIFLTFTMFIDVRTRMASRPKAVVVYMLVQRSTRHC